MRATSLLTALASLFAIANVADAQVLTLFDNRYFTGSYYYLLGPAPQVCYTLTCFNDRAMSAEWFGFSPSGYIAGRSWVVFYTDSYCTGRSVAWRADEGSPPNNFASDGVPQAISSIMVVNDWVFASGGYMTLSEAPGRCPRVSSRNLLEEPTNNTDSETAVESASIDLSALGNYSLP